MISESISSKGIGISQIILTGDSCKIPLFQSLIKKKISNVKITMATESWLQ
jgi:hypothetical protein